MYRLFLLGGIDLAGPAGPLSGRIAQPRPLALLALLDRSPGTTMTRDKAVGFLWPEAPERRARRRLSDLLYVIRQELGHGAVVPVADRLRLDPGVLRSDVADFDEACQAGDWERAAKLYTGPFLDGFHLGGSVEFDRWAEAEHSRLAELHRGALERLAGAAESRDEWSMAATWWKRLAARDPADSRVAIRLMTALAAAGNVAHALEHAGAHERVLREELDLPPDDEVRALARKLAASRGAATPERSASDEGPGVGREADAAVIRAASVFGRTRAAGKGNLGGAGLNTPVRRARPQARAVASPSPRERRPVLVGVAAVGVVAVLAMGSLLRDGAPDERIAGATAAAEEIAPMDPASENVDALHHYLQGTSYLARQFSGEATRAAIEQFERATTLDPAFARAWRRLVHARLWLTWVFGDEEQGRRARADLEQLLELDADDPEARLARVWFLYYGERRYEDALAEAEALEETRPGDAEVMRVRGLLEQRLGRWEDALATMRRALELRPRDAELAYAIGQALRWQGRYGEALEYYERAFSLAPEADIGFLYPNLEHARLAQGDTLGARQARDRARELGASAWAGGRAELYGRSFDEAIRRIRAQPAPWPMGAMIRYDNLADAYGRLGDDEQRTVYADSLLQRASALIEGGSRQPAVQAASLGWIHYGLARIHLGEREAGVRAVKQGLQEEAGFEDAVVGPFIRAWAARAFVRAGYHDAAIELLEAAMASPGALSLYDLRHDPEWDTLRDDSRFRRLAGLDHDGS